MHFDGPTFRPPTENFTPLLQVTVGCSYNQCAFCSMYRCTQFRMSPEEEIVADLQELAAKNDKIDRIFLLNGDPFALSAQKLLRIAELLHHYLPRMITITCYCSFVDLRGKSLEDLKALREAGYNDLYIGIESGYEPALQMIRKGYTIPEAEEMLARLAQAGIRYHALLMGGIAGKGKSRENAEASARLLNQYKPGIVSWISTSVTEGTLLAEMRDRGEYVELTEREQLEEEILFLRALDMEDDCFFFGSHPMNLIPISEYFSKKEEIIRYIETEAAEYEDEFLDSVWQRGAM